MFRTGAISDPVDLNDYPYDAASMVGATLDTSSISVTKYHVFRTQLGASCVAYAMHQGVQLHGAIRFAMGLGPKLPLLGPLYGYAGARILAGSLVPGVGLADLGSNTRLNLKWMRDHGIVSNDTWPETAENLPKVPPFDSFKKGGVVSVDKFYRIYDGTTATPSIIAALRAASRGECAPPTFVMSVGDSYMDLKTDVYTGPKAGESLSGHGQTILEWDETRRAFGVASTWGEDCGDSGIFWISEDFMNTQTGDKWVTLVAPPVIA